MSDLVTTLAVSASGMRSQAERLRHVSENVANADTPGYRRKTANFELDRDGQPRVIEAEGLLAVCIQHEMDHLLGKVFVEYLSPLKRNRIKTKLLKQQKQAERA